MSEENGNLPLTSSPIFFITLFAGVSVVVLSFLSFFFTVRHRRRLAAQYLVDSRNATITGGEEVRGGGGRKKKKQLGPRPKMTEVILDYVPENDRAGPLSWKEIQPLSAGIVLPHTRVPDSLPTQTADPSGTNVAAVATTTSGTQGDQPSLTTRQRRTSMISQIVLPSPSLITSSAFLPPALTPTLQQQQQSVPQAPTPPATNNHTSLSVTSSPPSPEATLMRIAVVIAMPCAEFGMPVLTLGMYDLPTAPGTDDVSWKPS